MIEVDECTASLRRVVALLRSRWLARQGSLSLDIPASFVLLANFEEELVHRFPVRPSEREDTPTDVLYLCHSHRDRALSRRKSTMVF